MSVRKGEPIEYKNQRRETRANDDKQSVRSQLRIKSMVNTQDIKNYACLHPESVRRGEAVVETQIVLPDLNEPGRLQWRWITWYQSRMPRMQWKNSEHSQRCRRKCDDVHVPPARLICIGEKILEAVQPFIQLRQIRGGKPHGRLLDAKTVFR